MAKTILLADDSLTIQKVVELTFADTDFEVVSTSSGDELLQKLSSTAPDVVVCDTIMPGIDGYDVCQQIKSDPASLHIPVIMLTGTFEPFDRDRALAVGCSEIITKPFEARKLVETVTNLVEGGGVAAPAPAVMEGAVQPPDFEGAVAPPVAELEGVADIPPEEPAAEEYGTVMEAPMTEVPVERAEEGLDFTSTGFAAMEAAGQAAEEEAPSPPETGLDYEEISEAQDFAFGGGDDVSVTDEPEAPSEIGAFPGTKPSEETQPISTEDLMAVHQEQLGEEHWVETVDTQDLEDVPSPGPFGEDSGESDIDTVPPEVFVAAEAAVVEEAVADHSEISSDEPSAVIDESPAFEEPTEVEMSEIGGVADDQGFGTVPPLGVEMEAQPTPDEPGVSLEAQAFEAALDAQEPEIMPGPPAFSEPAEVVPEVEEEDEAGVAEVLPETTLAEPMTATQGAVLSNEDIDRIARRVVELSADRLEKIAWEVIPDMAEIVIRERVRKLEAEIEGDDS